MPPNFRRVEAQVEARILASPHRVTFYYGKARTSPSGSGPVALPVSPLVQAPNPAPVVSEETLLDPQTMACLYLETTQLSDARRDKLGADLGGWSEQARALVRVRAQDALRPEGGLYFEGAAYAMVGSRRFRVLGWSQTGGSGSTTGSYYVQLGAGN